MIEKKLLKLETAANRYDINLRTLRQICITGTITVDGVKRPFKAVKLGKLWFIDPIELEKHLRRK